MAQLGNVSQFIKQAAQDNQHRTLILIDKVQGKPPVYCKFVHRYDKSQLSRVDGFFPSTYIALHHGSDEMIFSAGDLPILSHIGTSKVAVVTRTIHGCEIKAAEPGNAEQFIGLA